jgi:hypothetical protein
MPPRREFTIDRRSGLSYQEFVDTYLMPRKPVIIVDGLKEWPALRKWTPEFFKTNFGDKQVTVDKTPMRLGDYIDLVLSSTPEKPCPYLSALHVRQEFSEIAPDIEPDLKYTLPDRLRSRLMVGKYKSPKGLPELLISGRGGRFSLHYDALHMLGFVTQIYGDKEFIVFNPSDTKYLYPAPADPKKSQINNPFDPDLERFPLFANTTPCRFVLRAGETIFNPAGWWHATRMLSPSIAMVISTVNASNWKEFSDDLGRDRPGVPKLVTSGLRAYLSMLGVVLSVKEWMVLL